MPFTFTTKQRELLSAAAQREDRLFALPFELKGGAARRLAASSARRA
jgi:hypothetical protein